MERLKTWVGNIEVSTVDLRTTVPNWSTETLGGPYETCLFLGSPARGALRKSEVVDRWTTEAAARAGHASYCLRSEEELRAMIGGE